MPATSKAQQKFFGMVHAYQSGKLSGDKVGKSVKRVAKTISPEDSKKYAATSHDNLDEILHQIVSSPAYTEQLIREAAEDRIPVKVNGQLIDTYTANMISTAMDYLDENNKNSLLKLPVNKMVAASYKLLSY
jgi:hypothetical protein